MKPNINKENFDLLWNTPYESQIHDSCFSDIYLNFEFPYFGVKFTKVFINCSNPNNFIELKSNLSGTISLVHDLHRLKMDNHFNNTKVYTTNQEIIIKWYWNSTIEVGLILDRNGKISMLYKALPITINLPYSDGKWTFQHRYIQRNNLTLGGFPIKTKAT